MRPTIAAPGGRAWAPRSPRERGRLLSAYRHGAPLLPPLIPILLLLSGGPPPRSRLPALPHLSALASHAPRVTATPQSPPPPPTQPFTCPPTEPPRRGHDHEHSRGRHPARSGGGDAGGRLRMTLAGVWIRAPCNARARAHARVRWLRRPGGASHFSLSTPGCWAYSRRWGGGWGAGQLARFLPRPPLCGGTRATVSAGAAQAPPGRAGRRGARRAGPQPAGGCGEVRRRRAAKILCPPGAPRRLYRGDRVAPAGPPPQARAVPAPQSSVPITTLSTKAARTRDIRSPNTRPW